jgi:hypothetical protein
LLELQRQQRQQQLQQRIRLVKFRGKTYARASLAERFVPLDGTYRSGAIIASSIIAMIIASIARYGRPRSISTLAFHSGMPLGPFLTSRMVILRARQR